MTKPKYMALADVQTVWTDKMKPWINTNKADKSDLPTFATTSTCQDIVSELT